MLSESHVIDICRHGRGAATCRYLGLAPTGYDCLKLGPAKKLIDHRVRQGNMLSVGDNCEGFPSEDLDDQV